MKVLNKTHYYSPYTRVYNEVPDVDSFANESAKRVSYQQRLFFEMEDTKRCKGQAFFYTFTYNNTAMPTYEGFPCFNYDHVRLITNGIIKHELSRKYGSQLRYFCSCETGEGKGVRGLGNNPHYHFIFFVSPKRDDNNDPIFDGYKKISSVAFKELCRRVWQYKLDENNKPYFCDWKNARFGHCQPGDNFGLVHSADAFGYVAKYVTKSGTDILRDSAVCLKIEQDIKAEGYTFEALYNFRLYEAFNNSSGTAPHYSGRDSMPLYKYFLDSESRSEFMEDSGLNKYWKFRNERKPLVKLGMLPELTFAEYCRQFAPMQKSFWKRFVRFYNFTYLPDITKQAFAEYRNTYGNKVRCSKSLGLYGLKHVRTFNGDLQVVLNTSSQVLTQAPCLYYIRKLFYDATECPYTHNVLYTLNDAGVTYKVNHLQKSAEKMCNTLKEAFSFCLNEINAQNQHIRNMLTLHPSVMESLKMLTIMQDLNDILYKYSIYSLVYKNRHYDDLLNFRLHEDSTIDDFKEDYRIFLLNVPAFGEHTLLLELKNGQFISFRSHPYFASYSTLFDIIDIAFEAYQFWNSDYHKAKFQTKANAKRKLAKMKMNAVFGFEMSQQMNPSYGLEFLTLGLTDIN